MASNASDQAQHLVAALGRVVLGQDAAGAVRQRQVLDTQDRGAFEHGGGRLCGVDQRIRRDAQVAVYS